jgi:hypothetical protein
MAGRVFGPVPRIFQSALGETVTYTPQGGSAVSLQGIFTADYYAALEGGELQVASTKPAVSFPVSSVPNAAPGDSVTAQGTDYEVAEVQPDGMGMVALILHEA